MISFSASLEPKFLKFWTNMPSKAEALRSPSHSLSFFFIVFLLTCAEQFPRRGKTKRRFSPARIDGDWETDTPIWQLYHPRSEMLSPLTPTPNFPLPSQVFWALFSPSVSFRHNQVSAHFYLLTLLWFIEWRVDLVIE